MRRGVGWKLRANDASPMAVAGWVRAVREEMEVSRGGLAGVIGVDPHTISRIERLEHYPSYCVLQAIWIAYVLRKGGKSGGA